MRREGREEERRREEGETDWGWMDGGELTRQILREGEVADVFEADEGCDAGPDCIVSSSAVCCTRSDRRWRRLCKSDV
jgi:hypothetical protein